MLDNQELKRRISIVLEFYGIETDAPIPKNFLRELDFILSTEVGQWIWDAASEEGYKDGLICASKTP